MDFARHALAIDEKRDDYKPRIWRKRAGLDLKQVWFTGVHSDIGGGYKPGRGGAVLSDIPLEWMIREAKERGLEFESHLKSRLRPDPLAEQHEEYSGFFRLLGKHERTIKRGTFVHASVKTRWRRKRSYRPKKLAKVVEPSNWADVALED